jgi:predicted SAM-dependent methyltransferase
VAWGSGYDRGMAEAEASELNLHIGGEQVKQGWKILNVQAMAGVDFVGRADDLSQFADGSVSRIYASHVYEHLGYQQELPQALREAHRVLKAGGTIMIGVPDLEVLCKLLVNPAFTYEQRFFVQRMIMGGQVDAHDFHKTGFTFEILSRMLTDAGFRDIRRVHRFGLFEDGTDAQVRGTPISLNVMARK